MRPAGLGPVYTDGRVLALTLRSLQDAPRVELPAQARERIERTTHPDAFATLPAIWTTHGQMIEGKALGEIRQALRSLLDDQPFGERLHYPDKSERVLTRLGRPTSSFPGRALRSPFGATIDRVALPAHWLKGDSPSETLEARSPPEGLRFRIGASAFRYTRLGLEKGRCMTCSTTR